MVTRISESTTSAGVALWIDLDAQGLYRLDCAWKGRGGKHIDELPRFYRTARGARHAAALLTRERLTWVSPVVH